MYTNIPVHKVQNVVKNIIDYKSTKHNFRTELYRRQWYKENDDLAVGAPTLAILAETFIQHLEHTIIVEHTHNQYY
jgi:hypothetical protein